MSEDSWATLYDQKGVIAGEQKSIHGAYFVVADADFSRYRLTFAPSDDGGLNVGINGAYSDDQPGKLACYTPRDETSSDRCRFDEVSITDDGLLSVLARQRSAANVDIRVGFTVQLTPAFVAPVRKVLATLRERALASEDAPPAL